MFPNGVNFRPPAASMLYAVVGPERHGGRNAARRQREPRCLRQGNCDGSRKMIFADRLDIAGDQGAVTLNGIGG